MFYWVLKLDNEGVDHIVARSKKYDQVKHFLKVPRCRIIESPECPITIKLPYPIYDKSYVELNNELDRVAEYIVWLQCDYDDIIQGDYSGIETEVEELETEIKIQFAIFNTLTRIKNKIESDN